MERAEPEFQQQLKRRSGRQTEAEHSEDIKENTSGRRQQKARRERRTTMRKEDEEVRRIKTMRFRKKIEREEKQNTESEIVDVKVNEPQVEMENEEQLDPALVEKGR